jgi:hypothetical protein
MICKICGINEATIPDRESGSKQKKICGKCHAERLRNDLKYIFHLHEKKMKGGG